MTGIPPVLRGPFYMIVAGFGWVTMMIFVRILADRFSTFELLFFRNLVGVVVIVPWLVRGGMSVFRTQRLGLHALRTLLAYVGMFGLFYAVGRIALGDVVALSFTQPLFIVVLAGILLAETISRRRWLATAAGFAGVLVIVRPGFAEVGAATLAVLGSAAVYGGSNICIKVLMRTDTPTQALAWVNVMMLPLSAAPAAWTWVTPNAVDAVLLLGVGIGGAIGVFFVSHAYRAADASAVVPYDFLRLPVTPAAAFVAFGEAVDEWTWAGAAIIFAAIYSLARLEAAATRRTRDAPG
jgi:drug/metabolite transporter (DMT)-like permease